MNMYPSELEPHESNESYIRNEVYFVVVYPRGDHSKLSVATVQNFDICDYAMASRYYFNEESGAEQYASKLA